LIRFTVRHLRKNKNLALFNTYDNDFIVCVYINLISFTIKEITRKDELSLDVYHKNTEVASSKNFPAKWRGAWVCETVSYRKT
jgi:hypothetical protein